MSLRTVGIAAAALLLILVVVAATPLGRDLLFHVTPIAWTGEPERLAAALDIRAGSSIADIGAGNGALIVELARLTGSTGRVFATERTSAQQQRIRERAAKAGVSITVVEAGEHTANLPERCCDAITMRMVWHHVADPAALARDLARALRPGGRVGIIDFQAGAMPHLAGDHGVGADEVIRQFTSAGFEVLRRDDDWGGRSFLIVLRAR